MNPSAADINPSSVDIESVSVECFSRPNPPPSSPHLLPAPFLLAVNLSLTLSQLRGELPQRYVLSGFTNYCFMEMKGRPKDSFALWTQKHNPRQYRNGGCESCRSYHWGKMAAWRSSLAPSVESMQYTYPIVGFSLSDFISTLSIFLAGDTCLEATT